ncbi:hypothetical protein [Paraflavitalea pollutisoli]|uniref:hypothetical protein n=1 Tax=Paraflavitalea pollutisoli TaxID=3034143 RepID=UPI0023EDDE48|nr:hypothetical protein [Paraflavitalea sp. H1-2-19X]
MTTIFAACGDGNAPHDGNRPDTSGGTIPQRPPGESNADTMSNRGDTSMYQRMPNKTSDSSHQ